MVVGSGHDGEWSFQVNFVADDCCFLLLLLQADGIDVLLVYINVAVTTLLQVALLLLEIDDTGCFGG